MDPGFVSLVQGIVAYRNCHVRVTLCLGGTGLRRHDDCEQSQQHDAKADQRADQELFPPMECFCFSVMLVQDPPVSGGECKNAARSSVKIYVIHIGGVKRLGVFPGRSVVAESFDLS